MSARTTYAHVRIHIARVIHSVHICVCCVHSVHSVHICVCISYTVCIQSALHVHSHCVRDACLCVSKVYK